MAKRALDLASAPLGSVVAIRTDRAEVALTFDDGPDPEVTPRVLKVLAETGSTATFFVLLSRVRRYPSVLAETLDAGHEIALHGLDHRRLTELPPRMLPARISGARAELEDVIRQPIQWFRPPYGAQSLAVWRHVRRAGMTSVFWGPSTWDWKIAAAAQRMSQATSGIAPGAIVLAHDGSADHRDGVVAPATPDLDRAEWTRAVIGRYAELGLGCAAVGRLMSTGHAVKAARFVR